MKEYLFRGMTDSGKWVYGSLIKAGEYCCILEADDGTDYNYPYLDPIIGTIDGCATPVKPETVGQCVGEVFLADSYFSKTKIFEGDVLEVIMVDLPENAVDWREPIELVKRRGVVRYHEDLNEFRLRIYKNGEYEKRIQLWSYGLKKLKVIGNIHDNPDMLKGAL